MKSNSFSATVKYVVEKETANIIGGNMVGKNACELTREFMVSLDLNPNIQRPAYHFTLSLPKHEQLDDEKFAAIAKTYIAGMYVLDKGQDVEQNYALIKNECLHEYQYFIARHADREHEHIHIVASRINIVSGRVIEMWRDRLRSQKIIRKLEQVYGLESVPSSWEVGKKAPTIKQLEREAKTGILSIQSWLQTAVELAASYHPTFPQFLDNLYCKGIQVKLARTKENCITGISYCMDGIAMSGSQLGSHYSFPGIQQHLGISYNPERDNQAIEQIINSINNERRTQAQHRGSEGSSRQIMAGSERTQASNQIIRTERTKDYRDMDANQPQLDPTAIEASGTDRQIDSRVNEIRAAQEQFGRNLDKLERSIENFEREVECGQRIWKRHQQISTGNEQQDREDIEEAISITDEVIHQWRDSHLSRNIVDVRDIRNSDRRSDVDISASDATRNTESHQRPNQQSRNPLAEIRKALPVDGDSGDERPINNQPIEQSDRSFLVNSEATPSQTLLGVTKRKAGIPRSKVQAGWASAIYPIAMQAWSSQLDTSQQYQVAFEPDKDVLRLTATDGRGELVRYRTEQVEYVNNLSSQDLENWQAIERQLEQLNKVNINATEASTSSPATLDDLER